MASHYFLHYTNFIQQLPDGSTAADPGKALAMCHDAFQDMVTHWQEFGFTDRTEETMFFRQVFPGVLSEWFFWHQVRTIEEGRPAGPSSFMRAYYELQLKALNPILMRWEGAAMWLEVLPTELETEIFGASPGITANPRLPIFYSSSRMPGNRHAETLAISRAYRKVADFLTEKILGLLSPPGPIDTSGRPLRWAISKAALTELVYALHEYGVFDGRPEISRIATSLGAWFGVDLGNIYKAYEGIRIRKKDRTPFVSGLLAALQRRLNHDDLHAL